MTLVFTSGRYAIFASMAILAVASLVASIWLIWMLIPFALFAALTALGVHDVTQPATRSCAIIPFWATCGFCSKGSRLKSAST
jgi:hypothetical protein